ncbi:hypothetical protein HK102_008058 [Quaeritorhiza haematococci]|nr:hypothetical protein HK102_008058 [Quaeritorhiza haematococci]
MDDNKADCPAFLDAALGNLRKISFAAKIPDTVPRGFFSNCSNTLSVVRMEEASFSRPTFEVFATTCTGLRAFYVRHAENINVDGFEHLMKLRGQQLIALQLGDIIEDSFMNPRLIGSITKHCRSLEFLDFCFEITWSTGASIDGDVLDLVRQCGRNLRFLHL